MTRWLAIAVAGAATLAAGPVAAQAANCELHVWPTSDLYAVDKDNTVGSSGGALEIGYTLSSVQTVADRVTLALQPANQLDEIRGFNLAAYQGLTKYEVIYHDQPATPRFRAWLDKGIGDGPRISDSPAECYAELHVVFATLLDQPMKKILQTVFIFREFGAADDAQRVVIEAGSTTAAEFAFDAAEKSDAANANLRRAFRANLGEFLGRRKMQRILKST